MLTDNAHVGRMITLLVAAASVMVVGFIDDLWEVPSKYKLLALAIGASAVCGSGTLIQSVSINGHQLFSLGSAAWPVTLLWIIGVTVSINFIDGLDGLAAGIVALGSAVLAIGCAVGGYPLGVLLSLALCGSLCGFLFFNRNPAKIFMGDSGSMFIGFMIAGTAVLASGPIGTTRSLILPAITLSIPLFDTLFTMVRRGVLQRGSLFVPERGHIHHRLLDSGFCHKHVVQLLHIVTLAGVGVALVCIFAGSWASTIAASVFVFGLFILFRSAGSVRARETIAAIRNNRAVGRDTKRYQAVFYEMQLGFREAKTFELWWEQVCKSAQCLDFAKVDLPVIHRDGSETVMRWRRDGELLAASASITAEVPIPQRRNAETLRAQIEVLVPSTLESGGRRVALFTRLMGEYGLDVLQSNSQKTIRESDNVAKSETATENDRIDAGPFASLRVAIVHDFLYTYAGAERVLEQLIEIFPHASLFSLFDFLPAHLRGFIRNKVVTSTFLQWMPFARRKHRAYLPLMPLAIEQLDVSDYDLVISSSYVAAKGVITRPDQLHICYCHTP
ncbi:MAG TPA: hypothetical protein VKK61_08140, partial [Tepidisphaeraceae bacterium]|nr:hypothetical protein [Tepidisphaeraceae bacterium]